MRKLLLIPLVALLTLTVAAQEDDSGKDAASMSGQSDGMGGEMLGGSAETSELASQEVETLPDGPLAWLVLDLAGLAADVTVTNPAPAFLYAHEGSHAITLSGEEMTLEVGQATFVERGDEFVLPSSDGLWYSLLTGPGSQTPAQLEDADVVAESEALSGLPRDSATLSFVMVELPMGSATAVHSHPGPEYIYVTQGEIEYQTGMAETEILGVGDSRALPSGTAVQKRNPTGQAAAFVSWFVVDPDKPFAMEAVFE